MNVYECDNDIQPLKQNNIFKTDINWICIYLNIQSHSFTINSVKQLNQME